MYKILIIVLLISREVTTVIEVPLFRVDKFVKFEEFDDMLSVQWMDGRKNTTNTYLWSLPVKFTFQLSCLFLHRCVYFLFIISLPVITCNSFYLTHIPDKFIKFNEFNKIIKRGYPIVWHSREFMGRRDHKPRWCKA